ncbi:MAG: Uncharacterised protein [Halieaceae bacterium]|nr:MAG: Uncharacterised protein [Halieaceae bacterium]
MLELVYRFAIGETVREIDNRSLSVAVEQYIGLAVYEDRAPYGVAPVIIMRHATKAGLNAAYDHRYVAIRFSGALTVDSYRTIRAFSR